MCFLKHVGAQGVKRDLIGDWLSQLYSIGRKLMFCAPLKKKQGLFLMQSEVYFLLPYNTVTVLRRSDSDIMLCHYRIQTKSYAARRSTGYDSLSMIV